MDNECIAPSSSESRGNAIVAALGTVQARWIVALAAALIFFIGVEVWRQNIPYLLHEKSMASYRSGDYLAAQEGFQKFLEAYPKDAFSEEAEYHLAMSYFNRYEYDMSSAQLQKLLVRVPKGEYTAAIYYHLGQSNWKTNNEEAALLLFERVIKDYGDSGWGEYARKAHYDYKEKNRIGYEKAMIYFRQTKFRIAQKLLDESLKNHPDTYLADDLAYHHAVCHYHMGDYTKSRQELETILSKYPATTFEPAVLYHMGVCSLRLGDFLEARKLFDEIGRRYGKTEWATYATQRLSEAP